MTYTIPQLLTMSQAQLDDLFKQSPPGEIPNGEAKGTAIVAPGTTYTEEIAASSTTSVAANFDGAGAATTPFGLNAIAKVYKAELSTRRSASCSTSETSLLARWIRDEIRHRPARTGQGVLGQEAAIDLRCTQ